MSNSPAGYRRVIVAGILLFCFEDVVVCPRFFATSCSSEMNSMNDV